MAVGMQHHFRLRGYRLHGAVRSAAKTRRANTSTLVIVGAAAAFGYSLLAVVDYALELGWLPVSSVHGGPQLYFYLSAATISAALAGRYMELRAQERSEAAIERLLGRRAAVAHLIREGQEVDVPAERVRAGDTVIVRAGERVPVDGIVLTRLVEPGEVVAPGGTLLTMGPLEQLTITVYIPEDKYGTINLGQVALVNVDSFPGETFEAMVTRIADQAEFTPRNVQTQEDRRTTVFAIELGIDNPDGKLKPGMPADVEFIK